MCKVGELNSELCELLGKTTTEKLNLLLSVFQDSWSKFRCVACPLALMIQWLTYRGDHGGMKITLSLFPSMFHDLAHNFLGW